MSVGWLVAKKKKRKNFANNEFAHLLPMAFLYFSVYNKALFTLHDSSITYVGIILVQESGPLKTKSGGFEGGDMSVR